MVKIYLLLAALAVFAIAPPAGAQGFLEPFSGPGGAGCSDLVNKTGFTVRGSVRTAVTPNAAGDMVRHEENFAIPAGDKWKVCSEGPFFDGGKVQITIRTMFPVFECKSKLGGPIVITAIRKRDDSGYDWSATCY